ncbi:MAG: tetratricopeptide repeat protein [bacterium]
MSTKRKPIITILVMAGILIIECCGIAQGENANPNFVEFVTQGRKCIEKGDYECAIGSFTEAIKLDGSSAEALRMRGIAYYKTWKYDKSYEDLERSLSIVPTDAETLFYYASACSLASEVKANEKNKIKGYFFNAINLDNKYIDKYMCYIQSTHAREKDIEKKLSLIKKFSGFDSANNSFTLGMIYEEMGYYDKAVEAFKHANIAGDTGGAVEFELGKMYMCQEKYDKAEKEITRAINKRDMSFMYLARGIAYAGAGRCNEAENDLNTAVQKNNVNSLPSHYNFILSLCYIKNGESVKSIHYLNNILAGKEESEYFIQETRKFINKVEKESGVQTTTETPAVQEYSVLMSAAQAAVDAGNLDEAERLYKNAYATGKTKDEKIEAGKQLVAVHEKNRNQDNNGNKK